MTRGGICFMKINNFSVYPSVKLVGTKKAVRCTFDCKCRIVTMNCPNVTVFGCVFFFLFFVNRNKIAIEII